MILSAILQPITQFIKKIDIWYITLKLVIWWITVAQQKLSLITISIVTKIARTVNFWYSLSLLSNDVRSDTCLRCHIKYLYIRQPVTKENNFFSLFLRGGVPSPNFLKLFTILWKFYTTDKFYDFKVLYMTYL